LLNQSLFPQPKDRDVQPSTFESPVFTSSCKDTEAEPVGRFHYTKLVRNRPRTLDTWRVVTTSQLAADRVAQLLGGHIEQDPRTDCIEILTISSAVGILLSGPNALYIDWQRDDRRACDDVTDGDRQPRICPAALEQRRAAAKRGYGCRPRAEVRFRFQDDQMAGVFAFVSDDWSFVELIATAQPALSSRKAGRPVRAQLELRRSLHTAQRRGAALYPSRDHALE
jgi:hypothetical protein